jgi:hypothetical protein
VAYWQSRRFDKSVPLYERLAAAHRKLRGENHPDTLMVVVNLGANYCEAGRAADAIPILETVCRAAKDDGIRGFARQTLVRAYEQAGRPADALALVREHLAAVRKLNSPRRADDLVRAGAALLSLRAWDEAESALREGLALREKAQPGVWRLFSTKSLLGAALLGQKNYKDAEPLLLAGYEGLRKTEATIAPINRYVLPDAVDRLIELYAATNKPDELKEWRAERAKYPLEAAPMPREKK